MAKPERRRRQQLLRQAEGYLELAVACEESWSLRDDLLGRIVDRGLESLTDVEESLGLRAQSFRVRGQLLRVAGRFDEAVEWLEQAADLEPADIGTYLALGWCYKRLKRIDAAIDALDRAMKVDDREAIVWYNLACYWALAGRVDVVLRYLSQAFELDSNYRNLVATEVDFESVRSDPDFQALTGAPV